MSYLDKKFSEWLICSFSYPLGLRCLYNFRSSHIIRFINEKKFPSLEKHIDNDCCWVCLARIVFFMEIRRFLQKHLGSTVSSCATAHKYLEKIREFSPSDVKAPLIWFKAKNNHSGERAHIWFENGQIYLEILKPSEQDSSRTKNTLTITVEYLDADTVRLLKNSPLSTP